MTELLLNCTDLATMVLREKVCIQSQLSWPSGLTLTPVPKVEGSNDKCLWGCCFILVVQQAQTAGILPEPPS